MTNEERILQALKGARQMLLSLDKASDNASLWDKAIADVESHVGDPIGDSEFRLTAVELMDTVHECIMELVNRFAHEEANTIREAMLKHQMHERRN